ncbi:MAG: T9SS type A sorting domain-containing protein [bacterium]|nr:MAG: T9SS type A sorting domain-containing protein [bacterium]
MSKHWNNLFMISIINLVLFPLTLTAQWSSDPAVNTPLCTATNDQLDPAILADSKGGAYIVWSDHRNEPTLFGGDIFMQRINNNGETLWTTDGQVIYQWADGQVQPKIVPDGQGGNIILWRSISGLLDGKLYAQRTDSTGLTLWSGFGMPICVTGVSNYHALIANSSGGALIAWTRDGDIYAQQINSAGSPQWTVNGIAVCSATNNQSFTAIAADGNDGAYIVWKDERAGFSDPNIYAQHLTASGNSSMQSDGTAICASSGWQQNPRILAGNNSTAYILWHDTRNANGDIYAQRIDTTGNNFWSANGIAICNESHEQNNAVMTSDGAGGVIIAWTDSRNDQGNIYAQRINEAGNVLWAANGIPVCTSGNIQDWSSIISDGSGGAIICWEDQRQGALETDIYAQRLDASGIPQWEANGVAIVTASNMQSAPQLISDGSGGAFITWEDQRAGSFQNDIYVQWVDQQGNLAGVVGIEHENFGLITDVYLYQNYPNPFNPVTKINYQLPINSHVVLKVYDIIGREIMTLVNRTMLPGKHQVLWDASDMPSGIYYYTIQTEHYRATRKMILMK